MIERFLNIRLEYDHLKARFDLPDILGATWIMERRIVIDRGLLDRDQLGRMFFTMAHEVGHWCIHRKAFIGPTASRSSGPEIVCRESEATARGEWQADYFPASLLMPEMRVRDAFAEVFGFKSIACPIASAQAKPVLFFSLEKAREQLGIRLLCAEARVDSHTLRRGFLIQKQFEELVATKEKLETIPQFMDDTRTISILEIRAKARRIKMEHGLGLVILDYLQLMQGRKGTESRERPRLSDLRESGSIEQDADLVIFLHREGAFGNKKNRVPDGVAEIIIAKQRNGPTDTIKLAFLKDRLYTV